MRDKIQEALDFIDDIAQNHHREEAVLIDTIRASVKCMLEMVQEDEKELLPCPFCGVAAELLECHGTQYELYCEGCCQALVSIQISDLMTIEERMACPNLCEENEYKYPKRYIDRAEKEAIKEWQTRHNPALERFKKEIE